ncbi:MAG TPA: beta-N-acetylhexosaminidase [Allosphingosinicella sp.]|nr:beta-N-acetylhexosaminidase [Allosphingosinicella sp.]
MLPVIFGLAGPVLTPRERDFFREADPAGFILFARNCSDKVQLRALTDHLRAISGRDDVPILIDQEGGRVARMKVPEWPEFPAAWRFAELYEKAPISAIEAARVNAEAIALVLAQAGINVDCTPLLDVRDEGTHDVIGDRALGREPMQVAALGRAVLEGLEAGGVVGIVKHVPGHGRARADSHKELPVALASDQELEKDLAPFRTLRDAPMAMTAHLLYPAWDEERPASLSPIVINDIIRGRIGFDGLLMSDDLVMGALTGPPGDRARRAIDAGCDIALYCSGILAENEEVAASLGEIGEASAIRLQRAMARTGRRGDPGDYERLAAKRDALLSYV